MFKNPLYVYGDVAPKVPAHLHYGRYMLQKFQQFGDRTAIIDAETGESISYAELCHLIMDIALALSRAGVKRGDVVGICSDERLEYFAAIIGIICAGATFTPVDVSGKSTIQHRINLVKPKFLFCHINAYKEHKGTLAAAGVASFVLFGDESLPGAISLREFLMQQKDSLNVTNGGNSQGIINALAKSSNPKPNHASINMAADAAGHLPMDVFLPTPVEGAVDLAIIKYSSGTTGLSKAVPLTHLRAIAEVINRLDESYYCGKRVLAPTEFPPFSLASLHAGATLLIIRHDTARIVLDAVHKYKVQILLQMPSTILEMVKCPFLDQYDVSSLERILTGTSPLDCELAKTVMKRFPDLHEICQFYGSTESAVMASDEKVVKGTKPGSVGCARPGFTIKVLDTETRAPQGSHQRGEICVRGPSVIPAYLYKPCHLDEEGFYYTGDVGYYDEDQYFFIVDRIKDIIKYDGFTIAPAEIEAILLTHKDVRDAGVVGAPNAQYGECATAFVVTQPNAYVTEKELTKFVNDNVAEWMPLAGGTIFVEELPRGARGKIDRKALRLLL